MLGASLSKIEPESEQNIEGISDFQSKPFQFLIPWKYCPETIPERQNNSTEYLGHQMPTSETKIQFPSYPQVYLFPGDLMMQL